MKLSDMQEANAISQLYVDKRKVYREIQSGVALGVTFGGRYQNDDFVDKIRPHVLRELLQELDALEEKLEAFGIKVD